MIASPIVASSTPPFFSSVGLSPSPCVRRAVIASPQHYRGRHHSAIRAIHQNPHGQNEPGEATEQSRHLRARAGSGPEELAAPEETVTRPLGTDGFRRGLVEGGEASRAEKASSRRGYHARSMAGNGPNE